MIHLGDISASVMVLTMTHGTVASTEERLQILDSLAILFHQHYLDFYADTVERFASLLNSQQTLDLNNGVHDQPQVPQTNSSTLYSLEDVQSISIADTMTSSMTGLSIVQTPRTSEIEQPGQRKGYDTSLGRTSGSATSAPDAQQGTLGGEPIVFDRDAIRKRYTSGNADPSNSSRVGSASKRPPSISSGSGNLNAGRVVPKNVPALPSLKFSRVYDWLLRVAW